MRSLEGHWYSLLFDHNRQAFLDWYYRDAATPAPNPQEANRWWSIYKLEPTIYGVRFATESSKSQVCALGHAFVPFYNKDIKNFVKGAVSAESPGATTTNGSTALPRRHVGLLG